MTGDDKTDIDTVLKAALPTGPWQDEPDKVQWYDETTGMACLIVRNHSGALCGYAGVEPRHPWHGIEYGSCIHGCVDDWCDHRPESLTEVHGGLTYSAGCQANGKVCHVPAEGRPHDVWWFGFDCAHYLDVVPAYDLLSPGLNAGGATYKDMDYVRAEVTSLAKQLSAVQP